MVGQIQQNKARSLARWAYAAHSVDSPRLVAALDRAVAAELDAGAREQRLQVYVQVSLDGDPTAAVWTPAARSWSTSCATRSRLRERCRWSG